MSRYKSARSHRLPHPAASTQPFKSVSSLHQVQFNHVQIRLLYTASLPGKPHPGSTQWSTKARLRRHGAPTRIRCANQRVNFLRDNTCIGSTLTLTLAPSGASGAFKGYLLIGFDNANQAAGPIGTFSAISDGQTLDCPGVKLMKAATHINNANKTSVTVDRTAPAGFVGSVLFKTTFVEELDVFWVATPSSLVTVACLCYNTCTQ